MGSSRGQRNLELRSVRISPFREWSDQYKSAIAGLPEGRRDVYRKLRRQAAKPEHEDLVLPAVYEEPGGDQT